MQNYTSRGAHQPFCNIVTGYWIFNTAFNEPLGDSLHTANLRLNVIQVPFNSTIYSDALAMSIL